MFACFISVCRHSAKVCHQQTGTCKAPLPLWLRTGVLGGEMGAAGSVIPEGS